MYTIHYYNITTAAGIRCRGQWLTNDQAAALIQLGYIVTR